MAWGDGTGLPVEGRRLVVLGTDDEGWVQVRVFDSDGARVLDTDLKEAAWQLQSDEPKPRSADMVRSVQESSHPSPEDTTAFLDRVSHLFQYAATATDLSGIPPRG